MFLLTLRKAVWHVVAVCDDRGRCPLLDFLEGIGTNLRRDAVRLLALLTRVSRYGPPANAEVCHAVRPAIFQFTQGRLRVLWFYDEGRVIVCSHAYLKKTRKAPKSEVLAAERAREAYLEAKVRGGLGLLEGEEYS